MQAKILQPLLVNASTAAAMLGMSRSFFYENVSTGRIPQAIKYGKKSLWPVFSLVEHVRQEVAKQQGATI